MSNNNNNNSNNNNNNKAGVAEFEGCVTFCAVMGSESERMGNRISGRVY